MHKTMVTVADKSQLMLFSRNTVFSITQKEMSAKIPSFQEHQLFQSCSVDRFFFLLHSQDDCKQIGDDQKRTEKKGLQR